MKIHNAIAKAILKTATDRGLEKSTCPSEIARMLFPQNWRKHMSEVREVAILLASQGDLRITQKGLPIDTSSIKGPIRISINPRDPGRIFTLKDQYHNCIG